MIALKLVLSVFFWCLGGFLIGKFFPFKKTAEEIGNRALEKARREKAEKLSNMDWVCAEVCREELGGVFGSCDTVYLTLHNIVNNICLTALTLQLDNNDDEKLFSIGNKVSVRLRSANERAWSWIGEYGDLLIAKPYEHKPDTD